MLKKRAISVGIILSLATEIILGSITAYGVQFPLLEKFISTTVSSQSSVYNPFNDPIRKALDEAAKKVVTAPTMSPDIQEVQKRITNLASVKTESNDKQPQTVSIADLLKVNGGKDKKEVIVKYKDINQKENTKQKLKTKKSKLSFTSKSWIKRLKLETIEISDEGELTSVIDELKKDPNVEYVQPNYKLELMSELTDERFIEEWGLHNSGQSVIGQAGTAGVDINAINAWNITKGSGTVKVAIIDTGVDINHPDLAASIYKNPNELANGLDDDGNGVIDDINGWNFVDGSNNVFSSETEDTHGTHIAGIIAAGINNGGIVGVAPNVKILPLKFISGSTGYTSDAISAIEYCEKLGVTIANLSWGGSDQNMALKETIEKSNITFICAAGNAGKNIDISSVYPAAFDLPNIIAVAANDNKGQLASFSNYGTKVDLSAPGLNILSTLPGNKHGYLSGTSMAAPFVTGTVALLKSSNNSLSAAEIKNRIRNNVTKSANLSGRVSTSGRLNAYAALINSAPQESTVPVVTETPKPENLINKSKEPEEVYNTSLEGTGKTEKPLVGENNLFVDSLINKGLANIASSENGIENLSANKLKGNFISISWTTAVASNSILSYGANGSLDKTISDNELTTKHQLILKVDDISSFNNYKVSSTTKDGKVFESSIKNASTMTDLGGTPVLFDVSVSESVYQTAAHDISALSYIIDNNANHSFNTAQTISEGTVFGTIEQSGQHDYYAVNLTAGKTYSIKLKGMAAGEDYDMSLMDNTQYYLGYSVNQSNYDERITYTATTTGLYYIAIQPYTYSSSSIHHNYELMVYSTEKAPDSLEPNDSKDTAKPISENTVIEPTININSDDDWFVLDTSKTGKLSVTMKSIPTGCDYDMQVYNKDGAYLGGSFSSGCDNEKFNSIITIPGKYYIRIYSYAGSDPTDTYELKAGVYTADQYEVNDDIYTVNSRNKPLLSLNSTIGASIDNPDDVDCYKFTLATSTNVGVRLQNIPFGMDYDVVVYTYTNGDFTEVGRSTISSNSDEAVISQLAAGSYFIKVYSYWGSSESHSYTLSLNDETMGIVKIDFDKTSAGIGEIITATLKVDKINNLAGYQVNLKYDPQVLMPVDSSLLPFTYYTTPEDGNILTNKSYSPFSQAYNDLGKGLLTFGNCYINLNAYKASGASETSGNIAIIKFKVISENKIDIRFESSESMPGAASGVELFDWYGNVIRNNLTVQQPPSINGSLPVNPQSVDVNSSHDDEGTKVAVLETNTKISGYVAPETGTDKSGFTVLITIGTTTYDVYTNSSGYFEKYLDNTTTGVFKIAITKAGYLKREITDIQLSSDIIVGTQDKPVDMWAGDINQDGSINMSDIIMIAKGFNSIKGNPIYNANCDLNMDDAINMADVIIIAKRFGMAKYGNVEISSGAIIDIAAMGSWTVGLKSDGTVWDLSRGKQIPGLANVKALYDNKSSYIMALKKDGTIVYFDIDLKLFPDTNGITGIKDVAYNTYHTLFLKEDGSVYVEGGNNFGQLGLGEYIAKRYYDPIEVQGLPEGRVVDIAAGEKHSLALMEDGTVWAWGDNSNGALGVIDEFGNLPLSEITPIFKPDINLLGSEYSDYITFDVYGYLIAGENYLVRGIKKYEEFFRFKTSDQINVIIDATDSEYSVTTFCSSVQCAYIYGNLPAGDLNIAINVVVPDIKENENLSLNIIINNYSNKKVNVIQNKESSRVSVFERVGSGKIVSPVKVEELTDVKAVFAGKSSSYALKSDGTVWAWGENSNGELDIEGFQDEFVPAKMEHLSNIIEIIEGDYHIVALKSDGTVWTWKRNYGGILGLGSFTDYSENTPVQMKSLNDIVRIDVGTVHAVALKSDGSIWSWGKNLHHVQRDGVLLVRLGLGIDGDKCSPTQVSNSSDARLSSINIRDYSIPLFNPDITEYDVALQDGTYNYPPIYAYRINPLAKYTIILPQTFPGTVMIEVTAQDGITKKIYKINFTVNTQNPSTPDAPNEVFSAKGSIDFGGDVDVFYFTPHITKKHTILSEGGTDTVIDVYKVGSTANELIASNDDNESGINFYLECDLKIDTKYLFIVRHFNNTEGTGQYVIKVINSVKTPLTGKDAYLEDLVKECQGTISVEQQDKYKVAIDTQHIAIFDSNLYRIDPFNRKVIVNFDVFINHLGIESASSNSNSPENTQMELDYKIIAVSYQADKLVHDQYTYDSAGVGSGNIGKIQLVLRQLGCGKVLKGYGPNGAIIEELGVTGCYNRNTVEAIRQFKEIFMGNLGATGEEVDDLTAKELTKYNHLRKIAETQGGTWLKERGVRVREYLTKCFTPSFNGIFEFKMLGRVPKLYYREFQYAPSIELEIDDLYFSDSGVIPENKCYAKIKDIERAATKYLNEKVQFASDKVSSVLICPGKIDGDRLSWSDPIELKTMTTVCSDTGFFEPYADIDELAKCFNGSIGSPEQVPNTTRVVQFYNVDSVLTKLYFETGDNQTNPIITPKVLDARNKPVYGINFYRLPDPYVKNKVAVNVIQLAQYLGYYNIYSVRRKDNSLQLCIDASRIAKGKVNAANIVSMTLSVLPGTSDVKDIQEAITGVDLITGDKLSPGEQVFTAVCVFLPVISGKAIRIKKTGFIKATTETLVKGALGIKNLLRPNNEQIFEVVKSVISKNDLMIFTRNDGKVFNFSRAQLKAELMVEKKMTGEMAEDVLRCVGTQCFSGDTLVPTVSGLKRIDSIKEGDFVLSKDVNSGTIDYKEVKYVYIKSTYEFVHLKLDNEEIRTTANHLFFTDSGWWKAAENLKVGDKILNSKGELKTLIGKSIEALNEPERIYNLNVADYHTYFVGTNGLLVHNDCTEAMTQIMNKILKATDGEIYDLITRSSSAHLLDRHVGKTINDLVNRALTDPNCGDLASAFTNQSTAIQAIRENLRGNATIIKQWLESDKNIITITFDNGYSLGNGVYKGTSTVVDASKLTKSELFLVKDATSPTGFNIITGYPTI